MKLKKAMKKYEITKGIDGHYWLGKKCIYPTSEGSWWNNSYGDLRKYPESEAVAWLIEGTTPLSPMELACKKWPIKRNGNIYSLGNRSIGKVCDTWYHADIINGTTYTESEAVAYLLEGYKSGQSFTPDNGELKFGEDDFTIDFTVKRNPELPTMVFKNEAGHVIEFKPEIAQELIDNLWRAGYRPTKESK